MQLPIQIRSCDGCTECCTGWLEGEIHGHVIKPGSPCKYNLGTGCGIYDRRPEHPCKTYLCQWSFDSSIPEWMKPDKVKVICTTHKFGQYVILELRECGQFMPIEVLHWMFRMFIDRKILNVRYQVRGYWYYLSHETRNLEQEINAQMAEWPNATDCKPVKS
jgi:hypothetical protein